MTRLLPSPFRRGTLLLLLLGADIASPSNAQAQEAPADRAAIVHVLNRITFGPRPGDVEMVARMGLNAYIQQQLHPETIDDSAVQQQVAQFELVQMSPQQLNQVFLEDTKRFLQKQKELAAKNDANGTMTTPPATDPPPASSSTAPNMAPANAPAMSNQDIAPGMTPAMANFIDEAVKWKSVAAIGQLEQAKLVQAVNSPRQLQEVLVDFWGNHFNIDMKKGPDRVYKITDDRDVIRPHIWGSFRDLLEASAKSPAMLHYLDNASNTVARTMSPFEQEMRAMVVKRVLGTDAGALDPDSAGNGQPPKPKKTGGINENYGREIMELHTLGVDGGYTQQDVQEVARCFTGWTINRLTGEFIFRPRQHDNGAKVVLGHQIPAGGGMQDGETVLDILASAPATAHHIALEMCERFVGDTPSPALVDRIAGVFQQSGGNLRQVTAAILASPEFLSPADYNNKIKSPLEFAVSAVRASGSTIVPQLKPPLDKLVPTMEGAGVLGRGQAADRISKRPRQSLNWHILELGEPLFACTPPTGYNEVSKFWVSPGALIERLNFALALTGQKLSDVRFNPATVLQGVDLDNPESVLDESVSVLLQNNITDTTRKVLQESALPAPGESKTVNPSKLIALIIGSPEFQRK